MTTPLDPAQGALTVAVTGATGLIGSALVRRLRSQGHSVRRLLHSERGRAPGDVVWDATRSPLPPGALDGADAVIHLAGAPVAERWTDSHKRAIRESRVRSTEQLVAAMRVMANPPRVFLSGSAVGYYGDRGDAPLDESSPPGTDFLARVCVEWEAAAAPLAGSSVRVVMLRTGIVLSPDGGALERLLPIFKLGGGGPLGDGTQWMSWIGLTDHVRAMEHALFTDAMHGPANLTAPNPVTNDGFATTLGRVLARPSLVRVPSFALELFYGEMARATLLSGQRVLPKALTTAGFEFEEPTLEGALRAALGATQRG